MFSVFFATTCVVKLSCVCRSVKMMVGQNAQVLLCVYVSADDMTFDLDIWLAGSP